MLIQIVTPAWYENPSKVIGVLLMAALAFCIVFILLSYIASFFKSDKNMAHTSHDHGHSSEGGHSAPSAGSVPYNGPTGVLASFIGQLIFWALFAVASWLLVSYSNAWIFSSTEAGFWGYWILIAILLILATWNVWVYMIIHLPPLTGMLAQSIFGTDLIELHNGWFCPPWYKPTGTLINLTPQIMITPGEIFFMSYEEFIKKGLDKKIPARTYETGGREKGKKRKAIVHCQWYVSLAPRKGFLKRWVGENPADTALAVMSMIDIFLSDQVANKTSDWVMAHKLQISQAAEELFNGHNVSSFEARKGGKVGSPKVFNIDYGPASQAAIEERFKVEQYEGMLADLSEQIPDPEMRKNALLTFLGHIKPNVYSMEGKEILKAVELIAAIFKK